MAPPHAPIDRIRIEKLVLRNQIGFDTWDRTYKPQPLSLTLDMYASTQNVGQSDTLCSGSAVNYGQVCRFLMQWVEVDQFDSQYKTMESLAVALVDAVLTQFQLVQSAALSLEKPKALLHADCAGVHVFRSRTQTTKEDRLYIQNLKISTIIGINPWEQVEKQFILINLTCFPATQFSTSGPTAYNYRTIASKIVAFVESTRFKTIEALVHQIARFLLLDFQIHKLSLQVDKPSALTFAQCAGILVTRDQLWLQRVLLNERNGRIGPVQPSLIDMHTVYLGIGSNLGHRSLHIHRALDLISTKASSVIVDTSFMYLTKPMYLVDQPDFFNVACKIFTSLSPVHLLHALQQIELELGRTEKGTNGPRPIDIDILMYKQDRINTEHLVVPHPRMDEREFVLRPLADIAPDIQHPIKHQTISELLTMLTSNEPSVQRILPINEHRWLPMGTQTYVMGIMNVTPDSFSDGGDVDSTECAVKVAQAMVRAGVDILDIGGQSTRPNATLISPEEEQSRVEPVIRAIRNAGISVPISVDTFWSSVASVALDAGADLINDVTGGTRDPPILAVAQSRNAAYITMHSRGDPHSMQSLTDYTPDGVVATVAADLNRSAASALSAGIPRWNIVVDPGLGFAKLGSDNYTLVAKLPLLRHLVPFPMLVGPSRKRFIGDLLGKTDPKDREWGTAAVVSACVAGGADIVRVHDVLNMRDVVRVADRVYRQF